MNSEIPSKRALFETLRARLAQARGIFQQTCLSGRQENIRVQKERAERRDFGIQGSLITFLVDDIIETHAMAHLSYDYILSIASLHHIPPPLHRGLLQKIYRALAPNGYFFLTAWNLYHLKFLKFFLDTLQGHISNNETAYGFPYRALGYRDLFIPWKSPRMRPAFAGRRVASCECGISDNVTPNEVTNTIQLNWRYYHAFTKQSLRALLYDAGFTSIVFSPNDKRNFIIVARK
ncbi:MAG: class I SAM-dependent methyltransferase [Parcubacteria group bacterium]|nr:class I SAM-dependent methyltransferase [Parcubacteria group bacterium]